MLAGRDQAKVGISGVAKLEDFTCKENDGYLFWETEIFSVWGCEQGLARVTGANVDRSGLSQGSYKKIGASQTGIDRETEPSQRAKDIYIYIYMIRNAEPTARPTLQFDWNYR